MPTHRPVAAWTLALTLFALAPAAHAAGLVAMPDDIQHRLGVKTAPVAAGKRKAQVDAFAKVLDPEPLVQLMSDLHTAEAVSAASRAEAARAANLHAAGAVMSSKDTEAAQSQARQDALHLAMLRSRVGLEWGPGLLHMSAMRRAALVASLAAGKTALVHVDTPSNAGQAGAKTVRVDVGDGSVTGQVLGPARTSEPRLQSSGLIVRVDGPQAILLSIGLTNSAHIDTGSPLPGAILPRSALIRYRGSTWAYVRRPDGRFERRLVADPAPQDNGVFTASGFSPGEAVVSEGAAAVFAAELGQPSGTR